MPPEGDAADPQSINWWIEREQRIFAHWDKTNAVKAAAWRECEGSLAANAQERARHRITWEQVAHRVYGVSEEVAKDWFDGCVALAASERRLARLEELKAPQIILDNEAKLVLKKQAKLRGLLLQFQVPSA